MFVCVDNEFFFFTSTLTFRTCGLDDTCVLCQYCYNPEDHVDHQVTVHISQRDCGGVCDCGDPEAWVKQFSCKYHSVENYDNNPIPDDFYTAIMRTVEVAIDYTIDVFSNSHCGIQKFSSPEKVVQNMRESRLSEEVYGVKDDATNDKYILCLWNDQKHSFMDALNVIMRATHKKVDFGKMVTKEIDANGRSTVMVSPDLELLMQKKAIMEQTGLINTVRSAKDHFREEMCAVIYQWLDDLSKASLKCNYAVLRDIICAALCKSWNYGTELLRSRDWSVPIPPPSTFYSDQEEILGSMINSLLDGPFIPDISKRTMRTGLANIQDPDEDDEDEYEDEDERLQDVSEVDEDDSDDNVPTASSTLSTTQLVTTETPPRIAPQPWLQGSQKDTTGVQLNARVQYLIFFDIRLWKSLRLTLRDLYISVLVSNPDYKLQLGHYYAQLYPQVAELYMLADREPECSIISSLSTQLFTTPSIATDLAQYDYFTRFVAALYTFFSTGEVGPPTAVDPDGYISLESKILRNRRFGQIFHDIEYLLNRNTRKGLVSGNVYRVAQVAEFVLLFQGMSPIRRQKHKHVEYESEIWIYFFNAVPYVLQLVSVVACGVAACDLLQQERCISRVASTAVSWAFGDYCRRFKAAEIDAPPVPYIQSAHYAGITSSAELIKFKSENQQISLHHPLHAYLSWIVQYSKIDDAISLRKVLTECKNLYPGCTEEFVLEVLFDHPLRVLGLLSQIHVGLWVRNGYSVRTQLHHYREITLRDSAFVRDIFAAQMALVVLDPSVVMLDLLSRWSLNEWRTDDIFDEVQRMYMVEEFLHHLIVFVMDRFQLQGLPEKEVKRRYIVKEIIQCLTFRDMPFSEMSKIIPDHLSSDEMFETILREMSVFKPPAGIRDYGVYQLKPQYFNYFDTHYIHFTSAKIEEAESVIKSKIHKETGQPLETIVHEPPLEPLVNGPFVDISAFTRTAPFGRFIYDLLVFLKDKSGENVHEAVFGHVLQLLHVAALDDCQGHGNVRQDMFPSLAALMCADEGFTSIIKLLLDITKLKEFADYLPKVQRVIHIIREKNPDLVDAHLRTVGEAVLIEPAEEMESSAERKKRLGEQRKAQVLAEFQNKQRQFAQKHMADDMDLDDDDEFNDNDTNEWAFPESQCILCRMPDDKESVFGMMGHIMHSNVIRQVPFDDPDWVLEAFACNRNLDEAIQATDVDKGNENWAHYRQELHNAHKIGPGFPHTSTVRTPIVSGCGHGVHYHCYQDYLRTSRSRGQQLTRNNPEDTIKGEYLCPLCRALNNTFLPILWKSNKRSVAAYLQAPPSSDCQSFCQMLVMAEQQEVFDGILPLATYSPRVISEGAQHVLPNYAEALNITTPKYEQASILDKMAQDKLGKILGGLLSGPSRKLQKMTPDTGEKHAFHAVIKCFASTISTLEISLRGKGHSSPMGGIVVDQIPLQSLQIIRVFGEMCKTFIGHVVALGKDNQRDTSEIFSSLGFDANHLLLSWPLDKERSNSFEEFVSCALVTAPALDLDMIYVLKSYYVGSITNILVRIVNEVMRRASWVSHPHLFDVPCVDSYTDLSLQALNNIIGVIRARIELAPNPDLILWNKPAFIKIVYSMLVKALLPFLRKCSIFAFAMCGDYDPYDFMGFGKTSEGNKLCDYLGLPHLNDTLVAMATESTDEFLLFERYENQDFCSKSNEMEFPGVVRLLRLPHRLDEFFNLSNHSKDGKIAELAPDPAVCLFCGVSVGMQVPAFDTDDPRGQCYEHSKKCGKDVGIFLLPKRSSVLLLKGFQGSFVEGPYLDLHGEADETMR
jgi:E3 ubiquitin-protein ligase UBR1